MKQRIKYVLMVIMLVLTTISLFILVPEIKKTAETKRQEKIYEVFCNEQKEKLDKYLGENPHLSLLSYTFGTDKKEAIKLAAACYNKNTNQASNLIVISDVDTVVCLTFDSNSTEIHYLNEYPILIYSENELEFPLYHYDKKEMVFHRIEWTFKEATNEAYFKVLEEASESIDS